MARPSIVVYCVPHCGHARAVLELLRRRGLPYQERDLSPETAGEVIAAYRLYGSPVLVIDGEVVCGPTAVMDRIERLAVAG